MLRLYIPFTLLASLFLGCGSYDELISFYAEECGNDYYNTETQFCYYSKIYDKCGGYIYDPLNQKCKDNSIFSKCGNDYYNQVTQFCQNSKIYDKCDGVSYDPLNQKCEDNTLFLKCGNEWYNPFSQSCTNNVVGDKEEFIDSRDGKAYKYVTIGPQTWMAENLRYETSNTKCYDDNPDNCKIYGILYDWNTAKEVCPFGWHLPSDKEWDILGIFVDKDKAKLKASNSIWLLKGTDDFGFTALPGGYFNYRIDNFSDIREAALFWSATAGSYSGSAHIYYLNSIRFGLDGLYTDNSWVNVRCVKD